MNIIKRIPDSVHYLVGALVSLVPAWVSGAVLIGITYALRFATLQALRFELMGGVLLFCGLMVGRISLDLPASPLRRGGARFGLWSCFLGFTATMTGTVACVCHIVTVHVTW